MPRLTRRAFLAVTPIAAFSPFAASRAAATVMQHIDGGLPSSFPTEDPDVVREIVGKAHVDLDTVKALVERRTELAKGAWDWGFGDWESALGAASHMGRRDIAEFLIEHGARPNLFTFAMFGQVDVVRAICESNPGIQKARGPHGITLLAHARFGGDDAASAVEYLEEIGGADEGETNLPITAEDAGRYGGEYEPAVSPGTRFIIGFQERRSVLTFKRDEKQQRFLAYEGNHTFHPGGAPSSKIRFRMEGDAAVSLVVESGGLMLEAGRRMI